MALDARAEAEVTFLSRYYGQLKGATIVDVLAGIDDSMGHVEVWPTLKIRLASGDEVQVEVSRDPEGNGPGFLMGLPR